MTDPTGTVPPMDEDGPRVCFCRFDSDCPEHGDAARTPDSHGHTGNGTFCQVCVNAGAADAARTPRETPDLLERLAAIEHDQWIAWSQDLMSKELLTGERIARWTSLWVPYEDLSDEMKEHDRKWARLVLAAMVAPR